MCIQMLRITTISWPERSPGEEQQRINKNKKFSYLKESCFICSRKLKVRSDRTQHDQRDPLQQASQRVALVGETSSSRSNVFVWIAPSYRLYLKRSQSKQTLQQESVWRRSEVYLMITLISEVMTSVDEEKYQAIVIEFSENKQIKRHLCDVTVIMWNAKLRFHHAVYLRNVFVFWTLTLLSYTLAQNPVHK